MWWSLHLAESDIYPRNSVITSIIRNIHLQLHVRSFYLNSLGVSGKMKYHLLSILDFKLSPCFDCYILSFGRFPGVWILYADVSEHSVPSSQMMQAGRITGTRLLWYISSRFFFLLTPIMKMEQSECSETSVHKIHTPGIHPKERMQHLQWCFRNHCFVRGVMGYCKM